MPKIKYVVDLSDDEREYLVGLTRRGEASARKIKRAQILLKADAGWGDAEIATAVGGSLATVQRTRKRFVAESLAALTERPRAGRPQRIDGRQQAQIVALACSAAPAGHTRWSLRLLADKAVELQIVDVLSHEGVRQILKKTPSSPGARSSGVSPR